MDVQQNRHNLLNYTQINNVNKDPQATASLWRKTNHESHVFVLPSQERSTSEQRPPLKLDHFSSSDCIQSGFYSYQKTIDRGKRALDAGIKFSMSFQISPCASRVESGINIDIFNICRDIKYV